MITATLCTTNSTAPWAANVDFEINGTYMITTLKTKYAHYKNLRQNTNAIIVWHSGGEEIIAKATAKLSDPTEKGLALATCNVHWLRLVDTDGTKDFDDSSQIATTLSTYLA